MTSDAILTKATKALSALHKKLSRRASHKQAKNYKKFINGLRRTNPRTAHKIIYDKAQTQPLEAVKLPSGLVSYATSDIEHATTDFSERHGPHLVALQLGHHHHGNKKANA